MKLKIQYKGKTLTLGYISSTDKCLIGWYSPQAISERFADGLMPNLDLHVTYPIDGNIHYSYKFHDKEKGVKFDKKIYYDKIVTVEKTLDNVYIDKIITDRNGQNFLEHFVSTEKPERLDKHDYNAFHFPHSGILLDERTLPLIIDESQIKSTDIVLNVDGMEGKTINYGFSVYSKSRSEFYRPDATSKREVYFNNIYVEGFILCVN